MTNELSDASHIDELADQIKSFIEKSRKRIAVQVNDELIATYWEIGHMIVEFEQRNNVRAEYGKRTIKELSNKLTHALGRGFSRSNLQNMRLFYLTYEKSQTLSGKLSWTHYCELLIISDPNKRSFYEKECINS